MGTQSKFDVTMFTSTDDIQTDTVYRKAVSSWHKPPRMRLEVHMMCKFQTGSEQVDPNGK